MPEDIEKLKFLINYDFKNKSLLREALTHRTYAVENSLAYDNQRLEFLGDAVLEIILSEYLFRLYPGAREGDLTKMRSAMVNQHSLARLAGSINLGNFMITGKGEKENGGCERTSTLSDLFEALLGAFYLDAGLETAKKFVVELVEHEFPDPRKLILHLNPKGILQEYVQKKWNEAPFYEVLSVTGPHHAPVFTVQVTAAQTKASGIASNRKRAEVEAARNLIQIIAKTDPDFLAELNIQSPEPQVSENEQL
ncbi:MAG: ribonuclease III [Victivallaceae bacterium]|nr:ribonuclease III [Victivallaceae bacterium]